MPETIPVPSPEQLPDIPDDKIVFRWRTEWPGASNDLDWPIVILSFADREFWRGRTFYENSGQFAQISRACREKYPGRFYDIEYEEGEEGAFYGDDMRAISRMKKAHRQNRANHDKRVMKERVAEKAKKQNPC